MTDEPPDAPVSLAERLRATIRARGPLSFASFMELALYDPRDGYYCRGPSRLGPAGDYVTASDAGHAFGRSVARQLLEVDRAAGPFSPFHVVEFGAGRGLLARDVVDAAAELDPSFARRLEYLMVDRSPAMRAAAARCVPEAASLAPEELPGSLRGAVVAVELFDALPVHRVRRRGGRLVELFVGLDATDELVELEGAPDSDVATMAERYGAAGQEGAEAEVAPSVRDQLAAMAGVLDEGLVLVVDYGDRASELYGPGRHHGTLLAYHRHTANRDYLARVGEQDLTAHVNFSALTDAAQALGLHLLGLTTQDRFLVSTGILEEFTAPDPAAWHEPVRVKRRLQALQLIHPVGMGRAFRLLLLWKGDRPPRRLSGLVDPFTS